MKDNKKLIQIMWLQVAGVVIYLALGILALTVMTNSTTDLVTNYLTNNTLLSQTGTVFVSAVHVLTSPETRVYLAVIMGLSLVWPVAYLWAYRKGDKKALKNQIHIWRWLDRSIIGTLMFLVIANLAGVQDVTALLLGGGLIGLSYVMCWLSVHNQKTNPKLAKQTHWLMIFSGVLPWIMVLVYALETWVYGMVRSPWYLYALYIVGIYNFVSTLLLYRYVRLNSAKKIDGLWFERNILVINMVVKVLFAVLLIVGLRR